MRDTFEATVKRHGYVGQNGWTDELILELEDGTLIFEDKLEAFEGKRIRVILEDVE